MKLLSGGCGRDPDPDTDPRHDSRSVCISLELKCFNFDQDLICLGHALLPPAPRPNAGDRSRLLLGRRSSKSNTDIAATGWFLVAFQVEEVATMSNASPMFY